MARLEALNLELLAKARAKVEECVGVIRQGRVKGLFIKPDSVELSTVLGQDPRFEYKQDENAWQVTPGSLRRADESAERARRGR